MPGVLGDRAVQHAQAHRSWPAKPKAIILSGGPASVYAPGAPPVPGGLLESGVPILGICYGFQLMVSGLGGEVARTGARRVRRDPARVAPGQAGGAARRASRPAAGLDVARGHRRGATAGSTVTARTAASPVAAMEDSGRGLYGVQFHPEVLHTEHGMEVLRRFLDAAGCRPDWTMRSIIDEQVARIRDQVGGARAICGLSGGVDSAVAAALVQRAIGCQADLRVRRSRAAAPGRGRAGGAGLRRRDRGGPARRGCGRGVPGRARRGGRPGGEAQDHRAGVHPRVRAGHRADHRAGRGARRER